MHSPKVNRRYANNAGGEESLNIVNNAGGGHGIAPYRVHNQNNNGQYDTGVFEDTVMLRRDNNNQLTLAEPVGIYRQSHGAA